MKVEVNERGEIVLKEVFNPINLITENGETLGITMRDSGYEAYYQNQFYQLKNGKVEKFNENSRLENIEGFKNYRHESNPDEKTFHDEFLNNHILYKDCNIDLLVFPPANTSQTFAVDSLSNRELKIMLGTIQWLGSPVGRGFLRDCGYGKIEK